MREQASSDEEIEDMLELIKKHGCWYTRPHCKARREFFYGKFGDRSHPVGCKSINNVFGRSPRIERCKGSNDNEGTIRATGVKPTKNDRRYAAAKRYVEPFVAKTNRRCLFGDCRKEFTPKHRGQWYCKDCEPKRDAVDYQRRVHKFHGSK